MSTITYPGFPVWGDETIPQQSFPKVLYDLCSHLDIEPDGGVLENLTPISDRVAEGKEKHQNGPEVQRRKKSELLYQSNEEIIEELTRRQDKLEQQRRNDVEAGTQQNLEALDEMASIKTKLEFLIAENGKINDQVFDYSRAESYALATTLKDKIRDDIFHECCELRAELQEKIEQLVMENSSLFAQFVAIDTHTDFARIENEVSRGLNL